MSSDRLPDTLIVGGGIGGLSAALCIARQGGAVNVLEHSKSFAEVGAGIQLAPNATRILQRVGVLDMILPLAVLPRRLVLADAIGSRARSGTWTASPSCSATNCCSTGT
jgi:3-hydroxybenzoate 6-monooxygenase